MGILDGNCQCHFSLLEERSFKQCWFSISSLGWLISSDYICSIFFLGVPPPGGSSSFPTHFGFSGSALVIHSRHWGTVIWKPCARMRLAPRRGPPVRKCQCLVSSHVASIVIFHIWWCQLLCRPNIPKLHVAGGFNKSYFNIFPSFFNHTWDANPLFFEWFPQV